MILILNILNKRQAVWLIYDQTIEHSYDFAMAIGQDNSLVELDKLLKQAKIKLSDIKGLALVVKDSSLTQLRILTTVINTLGWQLNVPVAAKFYYQGNFVKLLPKLLNDISQTKKFAVINIKYQHQPDITISKKVAKYKISK